MTAETADLASPGEASFQLLAEHLPDLIIFAFDNELRMWAATGGALRARGWTSEEPIGTDQDVSDRRLAADLHDGHVQSLAAIGFKLEQARLRLGASGSPEADELLWQVTRDLSAEVTAPGQGTVVEARLPLTVAAEGPGA